MPRTLLDPKKHEKDVRDMFLCKIRDSKQNQTQIARELGLSQPSLSRKIHEMSLNWHQIVALCRLLEFDDDEMLRVMRRRR